MQDHSIRDAVRERYADIVRTTQADEQASCCGDDCCSTDVASKHYDMVMLNEIPAGAVNLSLGCGDPVTIAELKTGETVLDLGSGGGIDCFLAAKQVGATGYVIGVDMTPAMLEKANANKTRMGVQNVEFRRGHIEDLPVRDNRIDVIMSNCVINLSPDKGAVFAEAFRVLKRGGRVSFSDIVTDGEFNEAQRADMDGWAACVTGAIPAEIYTRLMAEAGFTDIQVIDKTDADDLGVTRDDAPRIFSARITAYKPA